MSNDPYNLQRFIDAQNPLYGQVCKELSCGQKISHWMWFIFPQISGLGSSESSRYFAISNQREATAYVAHPLLGSRLRECTGLVLQLEGRSADQIFGYPDNLKFHSSMTLFAATAEDNQLFLDTLQKYFSGNLDRQTLARIK